MPKDLWRKAQDVDHAKRVGKEIAETGRLQSYEHVFADPNAYPDDVIAFEDSSVGTPVADWLNKVRRKSGKQGYCQVFPVQAELIPLRSSILGEYGPAHGVLTQYP